MIAAVKRRHRARRDARAADQVAEQRGNDRADQLVVEAVDQQIVKLHHRLRVVESTVRRSVKGSNQRERALAERVVIRSILGHLVAVKHVKQPTEQAS